MGEFANLTETELRKLLAIHPRFGVGDVWRPDEGESHTAYSALVRKGLLRKQRCGDLPVVYWLTEAGQTRRAELMGANND